jgi:rRNA maturation endonuclease Nob1
MINNVSMDSIVNDVGITVPGSKSEQKFSTTYVGALESTKHSMVFKLLGGEYIKQAVTVKHKPKCVTCGKQNKATSKFCQECGTALEIFA